MARTGREPGRKLVLKHTLFYCRLAWFLIGFCLVPVGVVVIGLILPLVLRSGLLSPPPFIPFQSDAWWSWWRVRAGYQDTGHCSPGPQSDVPGPFNSDSQTTLVRLKFRFRWMLWPLLQRRQGGMQRGVENPPKWGPNMPLQCSSWDLFDGICCCSCPYTTGSCSCSFSSCSCSCSWCWCWCCSF